MTKKQTEIEKWEDKLNLELDILLGEYVLTGDNERKVNIFEVFNEALKAQREELVGVVENFPALKRGSWIMHPDWINRKDLLQQLNEI